VKGQGAVPEVMEGVMETEGLEIKEGPLHAASCGVEQHLLKTKLTHIFHKYFSH
jgi:hypothetical protein